MSFSPPEATGSAPRAFDRVWVDSKGEPLLSAQESASLHEWDNFGVPKLQ